MRGARTLLGIGALLASVAGAEPAPPLVVASRGLASIVVTGAGASGLRAGERLSVVRGEQVIGELEVSAAGASSASCRIVSQRLPIGAGDRLVLPAAAAKPATTSPLAARGRRPRRTSGPARGAAVDALRLDGDHGGLPVTTAKGPGRGSRPVRQPPRHRRPP
ncbi:MAG: hypothetical protein U0599_21930 [Vicinamibacteria bacterium]